jgi:hypothetical protein
MEKQNTALWLEFLKTNKPKILLLVLVACGLMLALHTPNPVMTAILVGQTNTTAIWPVIGSGPAHWLSLVLVVEIILLFLPSLKKLNLCSEGHANQFNPLVLAGTLCLTFLFSSLATHSVLNAFGKLEADSLGQTMSAALIETAGTALFIFIAKILDTVKRGYGFWILQLFLSLYSLQGGTLQGVTLLASEQYSVNERYVVLALVAGVVAVAALLAGLYKNNASDDIRPLLFFWALTSTVSWWIFESFTGLYFLLLGEGAYGQQPWFMREWSVSQTLIRIMLVLILGLWFCFTSQSKRLKYICVALFSLWAALSGAILYLGIPVRFFEGTGLLVLAWSAGEIHAAWFEAQRQNNLKTMFRSTKLSS